MCISDLYCIALISMPRTGTLWMPGLVLSANVRSLRTLLRRACRGFAKLIKLNCDRP